MGLLTAADEKNAKKPSRRLRATLWALVGLAGLFAVVAAVQAINDAFSPAGVYDCDKYEWSMAWATEVISLNSDSTISYPDNPSSSYQGTWSYSSLDHRLSFTNFGFETGTYIPPNSFYADKYLPDAGFEIGIRCRRR